MNLKGQLWVGFLAIVAVTTVACSASSGSRAVFGGCPRPTTPRTDATTGRAAEKYLALATPLASAIQQAEAGYVYSNPSKVVRARVVAAIDTFAAAAVRIHWPTSAIAAKVQEMVRAEQALRAYLLLNNGRDPQSVLRYRTRLAHVASPAWQIGQAIRADLELPLPIPC